MIDKLGGSLAIFSKWSQDALMDPNFSPKMQDLLGKLENDLVEIMDDSQLKLLDRAQELWNK